MTKLIRSEESKLACEQYSQSQTKLLTESIVSWYSSAISLERGALLIWEQVTKDCKLIKDIENMPDEINPSLAGTFMLLAGLSVENLLKANCIKSSGAWGKNGKFKFGTHNFSKWANHSGLEFSISEGELLERLENFVTFAGRYPAPLNYRQLMLKKMSDGSSIIMNLVKSGDFEKWQALVNKLKKPIENA